MPNSVTTIVYQSNHVSIRVTTSVYQLHHVSISVTASVIMFTSAMRSVLLASASVAIYLCHYKNI